MRNLLLFSVIAIYGILFSGCDALNYASLGSHIAGGKVEGKYVAFDYNTNLKEDSKIMSAAQLVATELGYKIESETPQHISYSVSESSNVEEYFGKYDNTNIYVSILDGNEKLVRIGVSISGNFNTVKREKAEKLITEFEEKLTAILKKQNATLTRKVG